MVFACHLSVRLVRRLGWQCFALLCNVVRFECVSSVFENGGGQVRGEHKYLYELLRRLKATRASEAEGFAKTGYVWPNVHPAFIDVHNTLPYCCRVGLVQACILCACLVLDIGLGRVCAFSGTRLNCI